MPEFKGKICLEDGDSLDTILKVESRRLVLKAGEHEIGNWSISELSAKRRNSQFRIKVEGEELVVDVADPIGVANALAIKADEPGGRRGKKPRARRFKRKEPATPEVKPPPVVAPAAAVADVVVFAEPEPEPVVAPVVPDVVFFGEPEPEPVPEPVVVPVVANPVLFPELEPAGMDPVLFAEPEPLVAPAAVMPPVFVPEPEPVVAPVAVAPVEVEMVDAEPSLWQRTPKRTKLIGLAVIGFVIFFLVAPSLLALLLMLAGVATLFLAIAAKNESGSGFMPPPFFATNTAIAGGLGSVLLAMVIMVIT